MERNNLIATSHVDDSIDDFHPERLVKPRRKAFPGQFVAAAVTDPDVAVDVRDDDAILRDEVEAPDEEERLPRVLC